MTPRQHEQKMRKWYVLLAVALFFSVFGEGFLMLSARLKEKREAEARRAKGAVTEPVRQAPMTPSVPSTVPPAPDGPPNAAPR